MIEIRTQIKRMIRIDTGFYIFDRLIITLFYKKEICSENPFDPSHLCSPFFFGGGGTFVPVRKRLRLCFERELRKLHKFV
jgi:hypothetical protein